MAKASFQEILSVLQNSTLLTLEVIENAGFIRATRSLPITGAGQVYETLTIIRNPDGSYALSQSSVYVPN